MDDPIRQQEPDTQARSGCLASLQVLGGILRWLTGFIRLTEAEREDAGIYLGSNHDR